jgi:hypothetical protein
MFNLRGEVFVFEPDLIGNTVEGLSEAPVVSVDTRKLAADESLGDAAG